MSRWLLLTLTALSLSGCGKPAPGLKTLAVRGTILTASGKPLPGGTVSFAPADPAGFGVDMPISGEGTFAGLVVPGRYKVVVLPRAPEQADDPALRRLIPTRYRTARDSDLTAEVEERGAKDFEFRLR